MEIQVVFLIIKETTCVYLLLTQNKISAFIKSRKQHKFFLSLAHNLKINNFRGLSYMFFIRIYDKNSLNQELKGIIFMLCLFFPFFLILLKLSKALYFYSPRLKGFLIDIKDFKQKCLWVKLSVIPY